MQNHLCRSGIQYFQPRQRNGPSGCICGSHGSRERKDDVPPRARKQVPGFVRFQNFRGFKSRTSSAAVTTPPLGQRNPKNRRRKYFQTELPVVIWPRGGLKGRLKRLPHLRRVRHPKPKFYWRNRKVGRVLSGDNPCCTPTITIGIDVQRQLAGFVGVNKMGGCDMGPVPQEIPAEEKLMPPQMQQRQFATWVTAHGQPILPGCRTV